MIRTTALAAAALLLLSAGAASAQTDAAADALRQARAAAAAAPLAAAGPTLSEGDATSEVPSVHAALALAGHASLGGAAQDYDAPLAAALRDFQRTAGLRPTGALDPKTRRALALAARKGDRLAALSLAQPAWPSVGRAIVVNIPAQKAYLLQDGAVVLESDAVVGKPTTRTPQFSAVVQSVTLNPTWTVPPSIAKQKYGGRHVVVPPGPSNPLGRVRLDMPNGYAVFLHGTDEPKLFARDERFYSHGCVRVKDIDGLARALIGGEEWRGRDLDAALRGRATRVVRLAEPVPVTIEYRPATVAPDGRIVLHPDRYHQAERADG